MQSQVAGRASLQLELQRCSAHAIIKYTRRWPQVASMHVPANRCSGRASLRILGNSIVYTKFCPACSRRDPFQYLGRCRWYVPAGLVVGRHLQVGELLRDESMDEYQTLMGT